MGRAGLDFPMPRYDRACGEEKLQLIQDDRGGDRCSKMVGKARGIDKMGACGTVQNHLGRALKS